MPCRLQLVMWVFLFFFKDNDMENREVILIWKLSTVAHTGEENH